MAQPSPESTSSGENGLAQKRAVGRMNEEVDTKLGDYVLIACCFCSGLIDAGAFNAYSSFVSMQTGNTIFLALGTLDLPSGSPRYNWSKFLCAIGSFLLGAFTFANYHRRLGGLKRWVITSSFLIQALFITIAAVLVTTGVATDQTSTSSTSGASGADAGQFNHLALVPISLLAFQAAGQVVASRVLKFSAIPTVVLTTLYADLMSDVNLFSGLFDDITRNQRAAGALMLFLGAITGGGCSRHWVGFAGALWLAVVVKAGIVVFWIFRRKKTEGEEV